MANLTSILDKLEAGRNLELRRAPDNTFLMLDQGAPRIAKKDLGSIFVEMTFGLGLTKYISGHLSIYGKYFHICMTRLHYNGKGQGFLSIPCNKLLRCAYISVHSLCS